MKNIFHNREKSVYVLHFLQISLISDAIKNTVGYLISASAINLWRYHMSCSLWEPHFTLMSHYCEKKFWPSKGLENSQDPWTTIFWFKSSVLQYKLHQHRPCLFCSRFYLQHLGQYPAQTRYSNISGRNE